MRWHLAHAAQEQEGSVPAGGSAACQLAGDCMHKGPQLWHLGSGDKEQTVATTCGR